MGFFSQSCFDFGICIVMFLHFEIKSRLIQNSHRAFCVLNNVEALIPDPDLAKLLLAHTSQLTLLALAAALPLKTIFVHNWQFAIKIAKQISKYG